ncbi:MAG: CBS domain-containing protein [Candidatus Omnitrophica bacterium]|nr:CBS domain-containing protein [Candidatus Omnitrophota bacterium]MBU1996171.1 CBS domain-containing protein [Candidatus Omnitrophota bacterium]
MQDPQKNDKSGPLQILRLTKVSEIMERDVITVREDEPLSVVHNTFVANHLTHVIVVDETNRISGIISQKYLYKAHAPRKIIAMLEYDSDKLLDGDSYYSKEALNSFRLKKIMKTSPLTVKPDKLVFDVASLMAKRMLGCVPVVDNNKYVVGVISEQILVKFFVDVMSLDI